MVDFKASLAQGLEAAAKAEASRSEIKAVFETLNLQLAEATGGKLFVERSEEIQMPNPLSGGIFGGLSQALGNTRTVPIIRCINPLVKGKAEKLCEYSMGRAGYPFEIKIDRQELVCHDRDSLEMALAEMLSDPVIGEKIMRVMNAQEND
ncbi:hypothetical protein [Pseudomonas viridiflava]|uniref:hypothetical protein n=1 Tax=Pseudomonas viridiflava TaxID=33069 RepID=UPI000F03A938|nr:hypothetical protein [Pseudomonas viridiflava]